MELKTLVSMNVILLPYSKLRSLTRASKYGTHVRCAPVIERSRVLGLRFITTLGLQERMIPDSFVVALSISRDDRKERMTENKVWKIIKGRVGQHGLKCPPSYPRYFVCLGPLRLCGCKTGVKMYCTHLV